MSETPDADVRTLLAPMADRAVDLEGAAFRVDRARVVAGMARAGRPERRGRPGLVLAAAACAALGVGGWLWHAARSSGAGSLELEVFEGSATQVRAGGAAQVSTKLSAARGARITAAGELGTGPGSRARVHAANGLDIELASETRVALDELETSDSRLKLLGGTIRCVVPRRAPAHPFRVAAADLTVVDLGTVFTVSLDQGPAHAVRISVEEGEVMIRHASGETRVSAPGTWSSPAPPSAPPATKPREPGEERGALLSPPAPVPTSTRARATAGGGAPQPRATLAHEARLLREGLAAERQGHAPEAISALKRLLERYPRSPLAPDARAALTRVEATARP